MRAALYSEQAGELFAASTNDDPHPFFARLRREHPISRVAETGVHLVAIWDLIDEVLHRDEDFSANLTGALMRSDADGTPGVFPLPDSMATRVIATADEPDHRVHRALAQPRLAAPRIAAMEGALRAWTASALEPFVAAGGGDFVPLAERVPARALAWLLGLPDGDVTRHRDWAMVGGDILSGGISESRLVRLATETGALAAYLQEHLRAVAPAAPGDGEAPLLAALAGGVERGEICDEAAVGIAIVMFGAGGESTAALIGSVVRRLAEDPDLTERLRADVSLVPGFVEEVVRLDPPFKFHYRAVRRACELAGASLEPGDRLMLLWASANRDAAHFEDADALRLDRRYPKRHLGFGRGAHFCIGAPLARLEARVVVEELLARTRRIGPAPGEGPEYLQSIFVRRLEHLPLAVAEA